MTLSTFPASAHISSLRAFVLLMQRTGTFPSRQELQHAMESLDAVDESVKRLPILLPFNFGGFASMTDLSRFRAEVTGPLRSVFLQGYQDQNGALAFPLQGRIPCSERCEGGKGEVRGERKILWPDDLRPREPKAEKPARGQPQTHQQQELRI